MARDRRSQSLFGRDEPAVTPFARGTRREEESGRVRDRKEKGRDHRRRVRRDGGGVGPHLCQGSVSGKPTCDVTIFQMGGRLGGKAASSRNTQLGDRIEEHGLHLWLGYYENAFRMVRTCFEELKDLKLPTPS